MAQTVFSKTAVLDFYGQPGTVANPPANFARMYYNAGSNQLVCVDSNGNNLIAGGGGGVSSFTGDGVLLSNSGSTGAITATTPNRTANTVYAGPASGSAAAGAFRALVPADLSFLDFGGGIIGMTVDKIHSEATASGNIDLYTVPANTRALAAFTAYNSTVSSGTATQAVKISGTYYKLSTALTVGAGSNNGAGYLGFIFEPGDVIALVTTQTMNIFGTVYLFPNTNGLKSPRLVGLTSGENTVYTCPIGKTAYIPTGNTITTGGSTGGGNAVVTNNTGGSLNYYLSYVNSGGSPGAGNKATLTTAIGSGATGFFQIQTPAFAVGDFISLNASGTGATSLAFTTVYEL